MCFADPATMYAVGAGISAVTAVAGGVSQIQQGRQAAKIAEYNAQLAENTAQVEEQRAEAETRRRRREARRLKARRVVQTGASGVDLAGSPLDVLVDDVGEMEAEALSARWAGSVSSAALRAQAVADRFRGRSARTRANYLAGTTILGGLGSAAGLGGRAREWQIREERRSIG